MTSLSLSDLKMVLSGVDKWNKQEEVEAFLQAVASSIENSGEFQVEAQMESSGARRPPRARNPRTVTRKTINGEVYEVSIVTESGQELFVRVKNKGGRLSQRDVQVMDEYSMHLSSVAEQVVRLDRLKRQIAEDKHYCGVEMEKPSHPLDLDALTRRERETVELLREGLSNTEISKRMSISRRTVEKHFESIYSKLGLENRYQLLRELTH